MDELIIEPRNANTRFALVNWHQTSGPYWLTCLRYADVMQVKRCPSQCKAIQLGWQWIHTGQIQEPTDDH